MKTQELKDHISSLPVDVREDIAEFVLQTLNAPDPEIERAWMDEVERRAAEVDSGKVKMIPGEEFLKSLRAVTG
jgi:putative addiction module component (TIGR02574 family)